MKFGNYRFRARGVNNLGDQMQIIAIDYLYSVMGIPVEEIVYIDYHSLRTYDGEYVILPVTMPMVDYFPNGFADRFSERIIPAFLGVTMVKETLTEKEQIYLRKYEPIGCRDERTLRTMRKYGILSYLNGCITVTLPRRENDEGKDVYIVDVDESCLPLIPEGLRQGAQIRTHLRADAGENPKAAALAQYREYKEKARLVITSLLHCSVPCAAAGIPVVLLNSRVSYRKAWLEKILPIYTPEDAGRINWQPEATISEDFKERVRKVAISRLRETYDKFSGIMDLSYYYEEREKHEYLNDACDSLKRFIDETWTDPEGAYCYSVWGLTQIAEWIADYIGERYPKAIFCHAYDAYRRETFRGVMSEDPENIRSREPETILVTTNGAEKAARELFNEIHYPEDKQGFVVVVK